MSAILYAIEWIRQQDRLRPVYGWLPPSWRNNVCSAMWARTAKKLVFSRNDAWDRVKGTTTSPATKQSALPDSIGPGINILGYLSGEFGLAQSARMYSQALIDNGYKVALSDVILDLPHGWNDRSLAPWVVDSLPYDASIIFINPDHMDLALERIGKASLVNQRLIACWFWELETIPEQWQSAIDRVDGIIVASAFIEAAFRRATDKPLLRVPLPINPMADSGLQREDFGLDNGKFIFLCTFDFHSSIERKNPFAVIEAFRQAFPANRTDVCLLIKSSNGQSAPRELHRLLTATSIDPRIIVRDEIIPRAHLQALVRSCDAYISLHRAEGFGLGIAEAMALGKPVIATGWSGNTDYMNCDNSVLVPYKLVSIPDGDYLSSGGARWAEPDVRAAADAMNKIINEPGFAREIAGKAAISIKKDLSPADVAYSISQWLSRH